jgi:hypothetical protein
VSDTQIQPRPLVPSERERSAGITVPPPVTGGIVDRPEGHVQRLGLSGYLRSLDIRGTNAPKMPLLVFGLSAIFVGWDAQVLGLVGPDLRTEFGVSLADLVTLGSILGFLGVLAALPMGYVVDRVKRVWLIRLGGILGQVSVVLQAFSATFIGLIFSRSVGFLGGTISGPASGPLTADYFAPSIRARVSSLVKVVLATRLGPQPGTVIFRAEGRAKARASSRRLRCPTSSRR